MTDNNTTKQVTHFTYLGCDICYEYDDTKQGFSGRMQPTYMFVLLDYPL
jgi:hypothetical protein